MSLFSQLCGLALRGAATQAASLVGAASAGQAAADLLCKSFTDHSEKLTEALARSHARAWAAVELSLAGRSWWDSAKGLLHSGTDRAFRDQVQAFLDANPLDGMDGHGPDFRGQCLAQLHAARKAGLLDKEALDPRDLAARVGDLSRFGDAPGAVEAEFRVLTEMSARLRRDGYEALATFLELRPAGGPPVLVSAMRYHFQREVEQDAQLFQGLAYAKFDALESGQRRGFDALTHHAEKLQGMLADVQAVVVRTHGDVLDMKAELARQGRQMQELGAQVLRALEQRQLQARELNGNDSLSIRDDDERRLVRDIVRRYRGLPAEERQRMPALLNAVGKLEVVAGNFEEAQRDFREAAALVDDPAAKAEVAYNAYRAALERRAWDDALLSLTEAARGDPARFAPFPLEKFDPERILGAGGFGVALLCRNRHTGGRVVIKTLRREGMARSVDEVFREAQTLEHLDHPAIIRIRDCDFADRAGGRPYFVMDYFAPGQTLEDLVEQGGPLTPGEALPVARLMASGLERAHQGGILHRDVKPGNVLVRRGTGGSWECKVIDFGLAMRADPAGSTARSAMDKTLITSSIAGTLDYAAPEQLGKLKGASVGTWSDVYGWGKTVCFALFGTPLPTFQHWEKIPRKLADLLGRCLTDKPSARPQTFTDVLRELDRINAPAPVVAPAVPAYVAEVVEEVIEVPRPRQEPKPRQEARRETRRERERGPEPVEEAPRRKGGGVVLLTLLFVVGFVGICAGGFYWIASSLMGMRTGFPFVGRPSPPGFPTPIRAGRTLTPQELQKAVAELRGKPAPSATRLAELAADLAATEPTAVMKKQHDATKALAALKGAAGKGKLEEAESTDPIIAVSKGLDPVLADANYRAREQAVLALRTWGTPVNVPKLAAMLDDGEENGVFDLRINTAKTLAAIGDPAGVPAVAGRLTDPWDSAHGIVDILVSFGRPAEDAVIPLLGWKEGTRKGRFPESDPRHNAILVLEKIGTRKSVEALKDLKKAPGYGSGRGRDSVDRAIAEIEKRIKK